LDIKAYIRELLFEQDCVIIPDFGGFIGNYSSARIDRITGTFHPPLKRISFNINLNHNDGLLISRISQSSGLHYGDARTLIENFVNDLKIRLSKGERVLFDHIGTFINNRENNIEFEPEANINYAPGSFGLESFQCMPVRDYNVRKRITRHIDKDPLEYSRQRKILWRAAVVIPIMALLIAVPLKTGLFKTRVEISSLNPLVKAEFEDNRKAVDESIVLVSVDSSAIPEPEVPAPPPPSIEEYHYSVITGSFQSEQNAVSHVNSLKQEGFDPEIVQASNGFYRVTATKCGNLETAVATRDSISKKYPGAWVSKI
jgi:hypothetical protein